MGQSPPGYLRLENRHTGEILEMRRRRVAGELTLELRGTLPPREEGPPLHIHYLEDEEGRVTAGTLSVQLDTARLDAIVGQSLQLPRGVPHRWWNEGDAPLAFEGSVRPLVDLDRYLHAIFEVINAGPRNRPPLFYMAHLVLRHRRSQAALIMPRPVQAVVLRVAFLLGTILGRYRGTDWPGCPARCVGAPTARAGDA
jgi:quercetin dioxygenase-like cupin family protein